MVITSMDGCGPGLRLTACRQAEGVCIVAVGELDIATADQLIDLARQFSADEVAHLRVDLAGLTFIDAAGLSALVRVDRLVSEHGGRLTLLRPPPVLLRLLEITSLRNTFRMGPLGGRRSAAERGASCAGKAEAPQADHVGNTGGATFVSRGRRAATPSAPGGQ